MATQSTRFDCKAGSGSMVNVADGSQTKGVDKPNMWTWSHLSREVVRAVGRCSLESHGPTQVRSMGRPRWAMGAPMPSDMEPACEREKREDDY